MVGMPSGVNLADHGLRNRLDLAAVGSGEVLHGNVLGGENFLGKIGLQDGIVFAGIVEQADRLGLGNQGEQQLDLIFHGVHVGGTGDVPAGSVIALDQAGVGGIGHGSDQNRNGVGRLGRSLGGGRGDGQNQIHLVIDQLGGQRGAVGLLAGSVEHFNFIAEACLVKSRDKAFAGCVERRVGGKLNHADAEFGSRGLAVVFHILIVLGAFVAFGVLISGVAGGQCEKQSERQQDREQLLHLFHRKNLLFS